MRSLIGETRVALGWFRNYNVIMRTKLIAIGNSKGIRIPKAILQQAQLGAAVDLRVVGDKLIISSAKRRRRPRAGWAKAIREEVARGGAPEIDPAWDSLPNDWDEEGWQW